MSTLTPAEIQEGLAENGQAPYGTARNVRAEELTAAAERSGEPELLRRALFAQIDAYEWSAERTKLTVPFARLLQEYDRDPAAFPDWEVHSLFWDFKWVTGSIVDTPDIPVAAVERWLVDMERRYRIAGYSERTVRQAEFYLADATGDLARADVAMAGWAAAERDRMSDCHACEINELGYYKALKGQDSEAIEVWEPVLAGRNTCKEEPHRVLAQSLLPLVRLDRLTEARSHHLRGYRLARGDESLLRQIGEHIEFCALTGNEPRGLEILAEHAAHLRPLADVQAQLEFSGGILVLLRRLVELGHGDLPAVPLQGAAGRTVRELYDRLYADASAIAARFDARNGNAHISGRFEERIARQPLLDALPLGVRSSQLPSSGARGGSGVPGQRRGTGLLSGAEKTAGPEKTSGGDAGRLTVVGLAELTVRARSLRDQGHPGAHAVWEQVASLAGSGSEADLRLAADLLEHRALATALAGDPECRTLFAESRDAHRAAGQHGRAVLAELRIATAAAQFGAEPAEIRALLASAVRSAEALDGAAEPDRVRRVASAELTRIRFEAFLRDGESAEGGSGALEGRSQLAAELAEFIAAKDGGDHAGDLAVLIADAEGLLAQCALREGDQELAEQLLASAADRTIAAHRPWEAAEPLARRAGLLLGLDRSRDAEVSARAALGHAAELTSPDEQASIRLTLAEVLLRRAEEATQDGAAAGGAAGDQSARDGGSVTKAVAEEAAGHALDAAHWFDQAGLGPTGGAQARLVLAKAYAAADRSAEAAEILQSALPDLIELDEGLGVQARELLGDLLRGLYDLRGAAEQYLLAAETTKSWDDPRPQAHFAHGAAEILGQSGRTDEAEAAYSRALELWRQAGDNPVGEVRVLRSLAWLRTRDEEGYHPTAAGVARARPLMHEALTVLEGADDPRLRHERAQTWEQLAEILYDYDDEEAYDEEDEGVALDRTEVCREAISLFDLAAAEYATLGEAGLQDRASCLTRAAWLEDQVGLRDAAVARLTGVIEELEPHQDGADYARGMVQRLQSTLKHWSTGN